MQNCVACRRVISNRFSTNNDFKSLGMLLKLAYIPDYAERLVIILDDKPKVWLRPVDRRLADMYPVKQQQYVTSDLSESPWLQRFTGLALSMHHLVFRHTTSMKPLPTIASEIALEQMQDDLRR